MNNIAIIVSRAYASIKKLILTNIHLISKETILVIHKGKKHMKEIVIMHPGPMNRGVEIDGEVADGDQAIILDQVLNGVASRMAILYLLCGGKKVEGE